MDISVGDFADSGRKIIFEQTAKVRHWVSYFRFAVELLGLDLSIGIWVLSYCRRDEQDDSGAYTPSHHSARVSSSPGFTGALGRPRAVCSAQAMLPSWEKVICLGRSRF